MTSCFSTKGPVFKAAVFCLGIVLSGCLTTERPMPPETEPAIAGAKRWIPPMGPAQITFSDKDPHSDPMKAGWPNSQKLYSGRFSASATGGLADVGCAFDNEGTKPPKSSISMTPPVREDERTYVLPPPGRFCKAGDNDGETCWKTFDMPDWKTALVKRSPSCKRPIGEKGCTHFLCNALWSEN